MASEAPISHNLSNCSLSLWRFSVAALLLLFCTTFLHISHNLDSRGAQKSRILSKKDKHEDITFYEDQRGARLGSMSGSDKVYASNKRKHNEREERTQSVKRGRTDSSPSPCSSKSAPDQEPDGDSPESEDECWTPNRAGTSSPQSIAVNLPRRILNAPAVQEVADRFRMSDNQVRCYSFDLEN